MKRVIKGLAYDTDTATEICRLPCNYRPGDFNHHTTSLYRTTKGRYFLAGVGEALSMWGRPGRDRGSHIDGEGIKALDDIDAREVAEQCELSPEEMTAAGFTVEDA